ncbi:MAG: hypothetical protein ACPL88_09165, partial [Bryobacteraceae bacterium]
MFTRQQEKLRPFLILADLLLVWAAFEAAYTTRTHLPLERLFFLSAPIRALLLVAGQAAWPLAGLWLKVYDEILAAPASRIFLKAAQQSAAAVTGLVILEYIQKLDLSRPFLALWTVYALLGQTAFRLWLGWI